MMTFLRWLFGLSEPSGYDENGWLKRDEPDPCWNGHNEPEDDHPGFQS